jgi:dolichol kinase
MSGSFWLFQVVKIFLLGMVAYATGLVASKKLLRVNYTRKINHFAISFLPDWLFSLFSIEHSRLEVGMGAVVSFFFFMLFLKPVRSRFRVFGVMFAAIDRPEDRPHTLFWFISQYAASIVVMVPLYWYFEKQGIGPLILLPLLINNIGDGLAEPVGVRFGKHRYATRALFGVKKYERSIEGSLCVLITGVLVILFHGSFFTMPQLIVSVIALPLVMTAAEAFSPHTWDAPFLLGSGGITLAVIMRVL